VLDGGPGGHAKEQFLWGRKGQPIVKYRAFCCDRCGGNAAFVMAALRRRCGHYIFALWFLSIFYLFTFLA